MGRMLVYPFAGAGIGFVLAVVLVHVMAGPPPGSDGAAVTLFVGAFLAGCGAIAGAIVGKVQAPKSKPE